MFTKSLLPQMVALMLVVGLLSTACNASIDRSPIKVTNRNSGPGYDLSEDVERVKIPVDDERSFEDRRREFEGGFPRFGGRDSSSPNNGNKDSQPEGRFAAPDIGRISIRRIFIVPVAPPNDNNQEESSGPSQPSFNPFQSMMPFMMMRPTLAGPQRPSDMFEQPSEEKSHVFGSDWRSRSPFGPSESAGDSDEPTRVPTDVDKSSMSPDPLQLLRIMLRTFQEVQNHVSSLPDSAAAPEKTNNTQKSTDLEKSASENEKRDQTREPFGGIFGDIPKTPANQNENREEVVEIEGKKYLRKTVLNRRVGENMIFVTRRLIFVPLNKTDSTTENSVPTTTLSPSIITADNKVASSTSTTEASATTTVATPSSLKIEEPTTTITTTTTTSSTTAATPSAVNPTTEKTNDVSDSKP